MNTEYVAWFLILVAVGVAVVAYLAVGPVPEIPAAEPADAPGPSAHGWATEPRPLPDAEPLDGTAGPRTVSDGSPRDGAAAQSSPVSTTEPGPAAPSGTSETP